MAQTPAQTPLKPSLLQTLSVLFKWRVVSLLLFGSVAGAFLAAGRFPGWTSLALVFVTGGLAASGAGAWNQIIEADKDRSMRRTAQRPLAVGNPFWRKWLPYLATAMIVVPVLAVLPFNRALAVWLAVGAIIYVGIYTLWLKPRSLLNIVIGGAAGSAAVLSGSAAVGNWSDVGAVALALLIFLWTPSHFWSLAIRYKEDYQNSETPMLPARTSPQAAAWWIFLHTAGTVFAAVMLSAHASLGAWYFVPVFLAGIWYIWRNIRLIQQPSPYMAFELFKVSNYYLAIVLLLICLVVGLG
jgi:protoheme IX farnesyltransferase